MSKLMPSLLPSGHKSSALRQHPLLRRLLLILVLIQAITLGALIWNSVRQHDASDLQAQQRHAHYQSILLASALAGPLQSADRTALLDALALLNDDERLQFAGVYSPDHRLLASLGTPAPLLQDTASSAPRSRFARVADVWVVERPIAADGNALGIVQLGYTVTAPQISGRSFAFQNTLIALLGLLLAIAVYAYLLLPLERDLERLQSGLNALRRGDWQHRVATSRVLAPLARLLNRLAEDIAASHSELNQRYDQQLYETRRLKALLHESDAVLWEAVPAHARFSYVGDEAVQLLGYTLDKWLADDFIDSYIHPNDCEWLKDFFLHPGNSSDGFSMELRARHHNGEWRWLHVVSTVEMRAQGPVLCGLLMDISEQKRNEARAAFLNDHDLLTELSNRRRFQERLQDQIAVNQRADTSGALLYLNLDRFRYLNGVFGHALGDDYLRFCVSQLRAVVGPQILIGRLDGDGFGILLPQADAAQTKAACRALLQRLRGAEFNYEGRGVVLSASIGAALFPLHGDSAAGLLAKADLALHQIKQRGRNGYRLFDPDDDPSNALRDELMWQDRLQYALQQEERLKLSFQPIIDLRNSTIQLYNSVLSIAEDNGKWLDQHSIGRHAERAGLSDAIDRQALELAMKALSKRVEVGRKPTVLLSLSVRSCSQADLIATVREAGRRHGVAASSLVFVLPAAAALDNPLALRQHVVALQALGHRCAWYGLREAVFKLDVLKDIPADLAVLDGDLVRRLYRNEAERGILASLIAFIRDLGATPIAAAVDNQQTANTLKEMGVSLAYGEFLAKPGPRFHAHDRVILAAANAN